MMNVSDWLKWLDEHGSSGEHCRDIVADWEQDRESIVTELKRILERNEDDSTMKCWFIELEDLVKEIEGKSSGDVSAVICLDPDPSIEGRSLHHHGGLGHPDD